MLSGTTFWRRCWFGKTGESEILHYFLPCLVISPPVSKDYGDPTHGDGEGLAAGKCLWFLSLLGWVLSLLGFFPLFLGSQISTGQAPKAVCKQGSAVCKGTPTHMETAGNERDTKNIPKTHPKHLRHSKPRENDPVSNSICQGKFSPEWRKQHRRGSQPWQISIIPLKSILLGQQVGINQILVDLKELRGFGLSSSGSAQPSPKASNEKQKEKGTKAKETKRNLHISSV